MNDKTQLKKYIDECKYSQAIEIIHKLQDEQNKSFEVADRLFKNRLYERSFEILNELFNCDHVKAIELLAYSYHLGVGVEQNLERAFELYLLGADLNSDICIDAVSRCYKYGIGTSRDNKLSEAYTSKLKITH